MSQALAQLCQKYWYPVYGFVRSQGLNEEERLKKYAETNDVDGLQGQYQIYLAYRKSEDHIKAVAEPVLAHRLVLREGMEFSVNKEDLLEKVVQDMEIPPWK